MDGDMKLPKDYFYAEHDRSLKIHIVPKDTKNRMNMTLCGITNTKINKLIIEMPEEKYMCKRCLYVLWVIDKIWGENMNELPKKELLRVDEVAEYFGIARSTVYLWIDHGILEAEKIGGIIRIPRDSILACRMNNKIDALE